MIDIVSLCERNKQWKISAAKLNFIISIAEWTFGNDPLVGMCLSKLLGYHYAINNNLPLFSAHITCLTLICITSIYISPCRDRSCSLWFAEEMEVQMGFVGLLKHQQNARTKIKILICPDRKPLPFQLYPVIVSKTKINPLLYVMPVHN